MFFTFKQRLILGVYIFLLLSIPVGAYLVSQYQTIKSSAQELKPRLPIVKSTPLPASGSITSGAQELLSTSQTNPNSSPSSNSSPQSSSAPTIATSFGPTLSLKAALEGRPKTNQATKLFVGVMEGILTNNPKFLLSFTINLPQSGEYSNLSLAGLNPGSKYTALLKGSSQIATSSAFIMSPTISNLNNGQVINMLSGDLNEDNTINTADYSIAQKALNSTSASSNWNAVADLNSDGVVNIFDLAILSKNIGQTGASGTWTSPIPKSATPSASVSGGGENPPIGSPNGDSSGGYWIWVPK